MGISSKLQVISVLLVGLLALEAVSYNFDYGNAMDKTLLFFEAQRSGKLPPNQRVKWRGDSGLKDGFLQGVNLVGGYYDAGDHVKFGLPMAYSLTMLGWSVVDYRKEIADLNQMGNTLAAIKWGTDYFIKAHTQPNILWAQVGDGDSDHYCWERAEDMTTPRTAYKLDPSHPGSDLAGEAAAALAAASLAFKPYDSSYSNLLLVHAKQDELLWAAAWLYRATYDEYYLKYVVDNAVSLGGTGWAVKEFSWDNKYAGGLIYVREWNNLQYASSAAFLLAMYSDYLSEKKIVLTCPEGQVQPSDVLSFAKSQADYILGKNPKAISYLVGYGQNYPIHVHHRGASISPISVLHTAVSCIEGFETWYRRPQANPNIIHGALLGGPSKTDDFSDDRSNYEQTEPTLSGSAPLIGLFVKLQSLSGYPGKLLNKNFISNQDFQACPVIQLVSLALNYRFLSSYITNTIPEASRLVTIL
ncbi:hypothetical protein R3W88_004299 [Solanum pinnatisectum]|uniref:Endoglucanase n=1 Tax=Solanum pinnatisectum TaxID=50273 RepID=A0AAV9K8X2_9SOLN|nr:hypothetical protein R3W88_004299 [Solanum pinnatisectum]